MSPKLFLILIVLLAVACFAGAGMSFFGKEPKDGPPPDPNENWIASSLDPEKRTLTFEKVMSCRLAIPADDDKEVRTLRFSVHTGAPVRVRFWGAKDERPNDDKAKQLQKGDKPMSLAVLTEGGNVEFAVVSQGEKPKSAGAPPDGKSNNAKEEPSGSVVTILSFE
jgi:hypothetical protein